MALVLLTNVTQYAGPGALDGLLAESHHVACHDASFADAGTRAGFDDRQGKVTAFAGQSPEDIHDEIMARLAEMRSCPPRQIEEDIQRLRDRLKGVSSGSSLTLSGMASGLLRQEQDAGNNKSHQNTGGTVAAERKASMVNWLVEQIAQGGAERRVGLSSFRSFRSTLIENKEPLKNALPYLCALFAFPVGR